MNVNDTVTITLPAHRCVAYAEMYYHFSKDEARNCNLRHYANAEEACIFQKKIIELLTAMVGQKCKLGLRCGMHDCPKNMVWTRGGDNGQM